MCDFTIAVPTIATRTLLNHHDKRAEEAVGDPGLVEVGHPGGDVQRKGVAVSFAQLLGFGAGEEGLEGAAADVLGKNAAGVGGLAETVGNADVFVAELCVPQKSAVVVVRFVGTVDSVYHRGFAVQRSVTDIHRCLRLLMLLLLIIRILLLNNNININ